MDQPEDRKGGKKWHMPWFDWLVFVLPAALFIGLGLESALVPAPPAGSPQHSDFRAVAHWFDPVFFQYNLVMALLVVLVVPSLALSYIQAMANRKERRLYRDVPPERRSEVRRRMGRRASFSTYRGSVWLTMTVVLLGVSILLLFKPVSSAAGMGLNFSLGSNMLTMGPFVELFEKDPQAYYSHLVRNMIAFQFGFLGAYVYFIGSVVRAYFTLDLTSHTFVDGAIRMIVASILALVLSFAFDFFAFTADARPAVSGATTNNHHAESTPATESTAATASSGASGSTTESNMAGLAIPASLSLLPVVAFFFGFYPKRASLAIERIALKTMRNIIPTDSYRALPLSMLAGMSYTHELRLEREGFDNVENLSTADAVDLAVRTCFSYTQLQQWIDQAWLASHLREDYPDFVRRTGISTSEELRCFLYASDSAKVDGVDQLVSALTTDPVAAASWKVRLTALKTLLEARQAPSQKVEVPRPDGPKAD
ncbi:hypothetical protein [Nitrosovibrio tenuis]|uniref:Uncharacterized protein n=1 Tax=Nitrosovibrio tenuis TaxID=1233 RepID=A0A1H7KAI4_9PROT|nr:hypothetical protein [Nitrosovibrio tenuis]SEK83520.1 hypothetical protein SAMN05216387_103154 [Nitrosovibrio tenuis]